MMSVELHRVSKWKWRPLTELYVLQPTFLSHGSHLKCYNCWAQSMTAEWWPNSIDGHNPCISQQMFGFLSAEYFQSQNQGLSWRLKHRPHTNVYHSVSGLTLYCQYFEPFVSTAIVGVHCTGWQHEALHIVKETKLVWMLHLLGWQRLTFSTDFQYFEEKAEGSNVGLPGTAIVLFRYTFNFCI